jgi:hypothetical protein
VKILHRWLVEDSAARRRFMDEMSMARRVEEFCTARVLDVGLDGDLPYIVSEFIDGESLHTLVVQRGPRDAGAVIRLAFGTAAGLAAIHRAGVVHRDFKPHNVLLGHDGPRVIDFGLAHALGASSTTSGVVGTPAYLAPEQLAGREPMPASDIFAWAGTMVFAATGRPAFGNDSVAAVLYRIASVDPALSGVPEQLAPLLRSCLQKRPDQRPGAAELVSELIGAGVSVRNAADLAAPEAAVQAVQAAAPVVIPDSIPVGVATEEGTRTANGHGRRERALLASDRADKPADRPAKNGHAARGRTPTAQEVAGTMTDLPDIGKPVPGEEEWIRPRRRRVFPLGIVISGAALSLAASLVLLLWPSSPKVTAIQRAQSTTLPSRRPTALHLTPGEQIGRPLSLGGQAGMAAVTQTALDGRPVFVTGGENGDLRVFNQTTGRQIGAPLTGHKGPVTALTTGTLNGTSVVVSGGADHTIRVWNLATGREIGAPFTGDTGTITTLATAVVNGRSMVVSGSTDWSVRRWDMATGHEVGPPILGHQSPITSMTTAIFHGQQVVAAGCAGNMVRIWNIGTGVEIGPMFMGHTASVTSLTTTTLNGQPVVISGGADQTIDVSNMSTGSPAGMSMPKQFATVSTLSMARVNGHPTLLVGEGDTVSVWDMATRRQVISPLTGSGGPIIWVTTERVDGVLAVVAGGSDGTINTWSLGTVG